VKVAYYSPLPPSRSGIADYSALLLPALRKHVEVEVARPGRLRRAPKADVALYHVGNDPEAHGWIVEALHKRPGVVCLHEIVLHHLVAGITLARGDAAGYLDAMERDYGLAGRLLAYGVLDNRIPPLWETRPEDFPLAGEVLRRADGLIVHSRYVEERAREAGYEGRIWRIQHPAWPAPDVAAAAVDGAPLFGAFGHQNESKRLPELYSAFARLRARRPDARLLVVGSATPRVEAIGPPEGVVREPYVDEQRLWSLMAACDAIVSLRAPTMGETSGSVVRALSLGRPLVVSDVGWFAELPDDVSVKVAPGPGETDALVSALERLAEDVPLRTEMGLAARALAASEHDVERVAELYAAALEEAAGGEAVRDAVLREVADAAAETGIAPRDPEAAELASRLREVGLGE
jgi:glycosyltransferase involved in cell wall biosynthesis